MARWSLPIKAYVDRTKGNLNAAVRACALEITARIMVRSPVDTGRFRGNWMIDCDVVPTGFDWDKQDPSGGGVIAEATAKLSGYQIGDRIRLRNNLPYSVALEYGHSDQAPQGMVRVTLVEFGAISSRAARKARRGQVT
jgi:hypothetical protein